MRDREERSLHVHSGRVPRGAAVQPQLRRAAMAEYLDVLPEHPSRVTGPESLHTRFFRRKPSRKMRDRIPSARTISNLFIGEDPAEKPVTVTLENIRDPWDVSGIEPQPDNGHVCSPA